MMKNRRKYLPITLGLTIAILLLEPNMLQAHCDGLDGPVVAIWMNSLTFAPGAMPVLVNFEAPRGCENTLSTFTPGVDKVTVQIKSR